MAKLRVFQSIENDIWILMFQNDPLALTNQDKDLMRKFGEPEINVGGTFSTEGIAFTLPDEYIKVVSGFPFRREFDSRQALFTGSSNPDTNTNVLFYRDAIITRFTDAFTTLRSNADGFTGEFLYNV